MGMYDITGWSNGTRMPLTYNLRAGQFRGLGKVSIFPGTRTVINNNFGGYDYNMFDYGYQSKTPGWMNCRQRFCQRRGATGRILTKDYSGLYTVFTNYFFPFDCYCFPF